MWLFVQKILSVLLNVGVAVGNQIKAAWVQARAIVLGGVLLVAKYWAARIAWRVAIAALFIALMSAATLSIMNFAVPEMSSVISLFATPDVKRDVEGVFHIIWDVGPNLKAFFGMLRKVVSALITAWSCRKLWSLFLVKRLVNPPL